MNDYMVSLRLCNSRGELKHASHDAHNYPLGIDFRFHMDSNDRPSVEVLTSSQLPTSDMRLVSACLMKMESNPGHEFTFKGKSAPNMGPDDPMQHLEWYPPEEGSSSTSHLLLRFGEVPSSRLPVRKPRLPCSWITRYLLHRTNLLEHREEPLHLFCNFAFPISIWWGLVGLRTIDRWWVIKELVEEGMWFATHGPPGFDPLLFRPVNGTLPKGTYLKVWVSVLPDRRLSNNWFRFNSRGLILVDDDPQEDPRRDELSNSWGGGDTPNEGGSGRKAPESAQSVVLWKGDSRGQFRVRQAGDRESLDNSWMASRSIPRADSSTDSPISVAAQDHHWDPPPRVHKSIRYDPLYLMNEPLPARMFNMGQTKVDLECLFQYGTGLDLKYWHPELRNDDGGDLGDFYRPRSKRRCRKFKESYEVAQQEEQSHSLQQQDFFDRRQGQSDFVGAGRTKSKRSHRLSEPAGTEAYTTEVKGADYRLREPLAETHGRYGPSNFGEDIPPENHRGGEYISSSRNLRGHYQDPRSRRGYDSPMDYHEPDFREPRYPQEDRPKRQQREQQQREQQPLPQDMYAGYEEYEHDNVYISAEGNDDSDDGDSVYSRNYDRRPRYRREEQQLLPQDMYAGHEEYEHDNVYMSAEGNDDGYDDGSVNAHNYRRRPRYRREEVYNRYSP